MGVVNVTPDSFSDGGRYFDVEVALQYARQMLADGADLIDVGGESTRPGAVPVSEADELARVLPVIATLLINNLSQIEYVCGHWGGRYPDIGHAERFISDYFVRFAGVRAFLDQTVASAREKGYVETIFGRRRYIPEITSSNAAIRQFAERTAINAQTRNVVFTIYAPAGIGEETILNHLHDLQENVLLVAPDARIELLQVYGAR